MAEGRDLTEAQHGEAAAKLADTWARIGFEPFADGVHILDCHLQRPHDLLMERQREFRSCAGPGATPPFVRMAGFGRRGG
ncbi:hypothetical protein [Streptomyces sp. NPDC089795]|uniref:hypothetical protein n=1 Tax=Streptomyces sp. NPDC089795 TaxID=3155297 RepID=UPI00342C3CF0